MDIFHSPFVLYSDCHCSFLCAPSGSPIKKGSILCFLVVWAYLCAQCLHSYVFLSVLLWCYWDKVLLYRQVNLEFTVWLRLALAFQFSCLTILNSLSHQATEFLYCFIFLLRAKRRGRCHSSPLSVRQWPSNVKLHLASALWRSGLFFTILKRIQMAHLMQSCSYLQTSDLSFIFSTRALCVALDPLSFLSLGGTF